MDGLAKVLGVVLFLVIVCFALYTISNWAINLVEVKVIKKVNPSYKTKIELEGEEKLKKAELARQEEEIRQREIELEDIERLKEDQMSEYVHRWDIENALKKRGYNFVFPPGCGFYVLGNRIWVCGILFTEDLEGKHEYPSIVISEDGGTTYELIKIFNEFKPPYASNLFFSKNGCGYLSVNAWDYCILYETTDGGRTWSIILNTKNIYGIYNLRIGFIKIRVANQKISLVGSVREGGLFEAVESNDGGKSWTYKRDNKEVAKTFDKGATWQVVGGRK